MGHKWEIYGTYMGNIWEIYGNIMEYILVGGFQPTPVKNMSLSVGITSFRICGKLKHVPNHQPVQITSYSNSRKIYTLWPFMVGFAG